jgi:TolA-binding protein
MYQSDGGSIWVGPRPHTRPLRCQWQPLTHQFPLRYPTQHANTATASCPPLEPHPEAGAVELLIHSGAVSVRKELTLYRPLVRGGAFCLGFCLLLWSLSSSVCGQKPDEASLYSIAVQAYQDGLLDLAHDQLRAYLATYPQGRHIAEVHYLLGDYAFRQGNFPQAVQSLQDALQSQLPIALHDDVRYLLGRSAMETGDYAKAVEAFRPLIESSQSDRWHEAGLYWSGEAQLRMNDFTGAARSLTRLVESQPNTTYLESALYALGYAWQKADAQVQSLEAFQQLLQRFPQSQLQGAAESGIARALVALHRFGEAAPHWRRLSEEATSPAQAEEATFWWAESWARADRCDHAKPAFEDYLRRFPKGHQRGDALAALALCAHSVGELAAEIGAGEAFLQEFSDDPRRGPMLLQLASAYEQSGQSEKAGELYSQWLQTFPDHVQRPEVLMRRGLISRAHGNDAGAIQDFVEVLRQASDPQQRLLAHVVLGESYVKRDDCTAALPHLSAVIEAGDRPSQQQARWRRGLCAYRNKSFAAAVEDFDQLIDDASFDGERQNLLLLLGQSLAALKRDSEAVNRFRQYLAVAPEGATAAQALAGLAASLLNLGQVDAALTVYEQLLRVAPELPSGGALHLQLALLYLERQATDLAKQHLDAAAKGRDAAVAAEAMYRLADLLVAEGMTAEATALLQQLTTAFASQPGWVGIASYRLALLYEAAEEWPKAWQAYIAAANTTTDPKLIQAARDRAQHLEETVDVDARQQPAPSQSEHHL